MTRTILLALLVTPLLSAANGAEAAAAAPPNIVLIMADDLGYRALGCYGQEQIKTPNIDRIAAEGMRFSCCYSGAHVCQPSRSVLMTGLHTGHTPARANDTQQFLRESDVTVAEVLKSRGYATGGFGKWGLGYEGTTGHPNRQGFDEWFGQYLQVHAHFYYPYWVWHNNEKVFLKENFNGQRKQYVQDEIHKAAMTFIREHSKGPFFAYLPYIIPHVELTVPEDSEIPYRGKFPKVAIHDPRANYIGSDDGLVTFAGMVSRLDRQVGEVLDLLDELGVAENTVVIFTSDNGAQGGGKENGWAKMNDYFKTNGNLRGYKGSFYEGGIREPLLVKWPGKVTAGSTSDHVVAFWDMMPTLAEMAGANAPQGIDGVSFVPTLTGQGEQKQAEGYYWEYPVRGGIGRAARMGRWKAVQPRPQDDVELYDLAADESEAHNLANEHPEIVQQLVAFMDRSHVEARPPEGPVARTGVEDYVQLPK